jgi:hypothetical protein
MWLQELIRKNLKLLILLQLDFAPKAEDLGNILNIWTLAFMRSFSADEKLDAHRIDYAFQKMLPELKKWPSPAMIIEQMPSRLHVARVDYDPRDHEEKDGSDINKMSKALCDLSDGIISKVEFDNRMAGLSVKNSQGAGTHLDKTADRD